MEFLSRKGTETRRCGITRALVGVLGLCAAVSACAVSVPGTRQYQDESTAVTVTITTEPIVLAREVSLLAANARDYLSLFPVEVNRAGQRRYYLFAYSWSTIDRRETAGAPDPGPSAFTLRADDRDIVLRMPAREFQSAGVAQLPVPPPVPTAIPLLFPADRATLLFIGTARVLSAQHADLAAGSPTERYVMWSRPPGGFTPFFERIAPAATQAEPRPRQ